MCRIWDPWGMIQASFWRNWTFCIQISYCCSFFSKNHCFSISDHFFKDLIIITISNNWSGTYHHSDVEWISNISTWTIGLLWSKVALLKKGISKLQAKDEKNMITYEQMSDSGGSLLFVRLQMCQASLFCSRHPAIADVDVPCWFYNYVTTD